jgi:hypothetical protein
MCFFAPFSVSFKMCVYHSGTPIGLWGTKSSEISLAQIISERFFLKLKTEPIYGRGKVSILL